MNTILVVHGPNLNTLGKRNSKIYGNVSLDQINRILARIARLHNFITTFLQSNHEGKLIDFIQKNSENAAGILINPGAFTHYSYALRDALQDSGLPVVEVHLSDINHREEFRKIDVLDGIVKAKVSGLKEKSYIVGLQKLMKLLSVH